MVEFGQTYIIMKLYYSLLWFENTAQTKFEDKISDCPLYCVND